LAAKVIFPIKAMGHLADKYPFIAALALDDFSMFCDSMT